MIRSSILGDLTLLNILFNVFHCIQCFDQNFGELVERHIPKVIVYAHGLHCTYHTRMMMNKFYFNEHKQDT